MSSTPEQQSSPKLKPYLNDRKHQLKIIRETYVTQDRRGRKTEFVDAVCDCGTLRRQIERRSWLSGLVKTCVPCARRNSGRKKKTTDTVILDWLEKEFRKPSVHFWNLFRDVEQGANLRHTATIIIKTLSNKRKLS